VRLAFISLMEDVPWGGSEQLWVLAARRALDEGHEVAVSYKEWDPLWPQLTGLVQAGAHAWSRPGGPAGFVSPTGRHLPSAVNGALARVHPGRFAGRDAASTSLEARLCAFDADVVCVSQGVSYEIGRYQVHELLAGLDGPYVVLTHGADDRHDTDQATRVRLRDAYEGAAACGFAASVVQRCAERQMACGVARSWVFPNPHGARGSTPVPWPDGGVSGRCELAYVGRVSVSKGIDALLEALGTGAWADRDFRLRLFGDRHQPQYFERLARHFGIADRVDFCGYTSDVARVWAESELLVFPSRLEGAPIALTEAMLCGRPAVATTVGVIGDWLVEGETGFLAQGPDAGPLRDALERAWTARARWPEMGERAHRAARDRVSADPAGDLLRRLVAVAGG